MNKSEGACTREGADTRRCVKASGALLWIRGHERDIRLIVRGAASWTKPVEIVLDVPVAEEADLVAALAREKVLVGHIQVLHAQRTACRPGTQRIVLE